LKHSYDISSEEYDEIVPALSEPKTIIGMTHVIVGNHAVYGEVVIVRRGRQITMLSEKPYARFV
jgi:hypothetical protein